MTLGENTIPERIAYAREPRKLPMVLSGEEVIRFLEAVSSLKSRVALTTAYAAGLRVSEVTGLKICDIDSERMVLRIECGKGGKERYVMLSQQLLAILRSYWRLARPERFLFPGRDKDKPIEATVLHAAGLPAQTAARLSGHSMRVGAAQDMIVSGLSILPIMQAGGWKSMNVVGRYVENANLSPLLEEARVAMRRNNGPSNS